MMSRSKFLSNPRDSIVYALLGVCFLWPMAVSAESVGVNSLNYFFKNTTTFKARFGQVVMDDRSNILDEAQGTVWIQRPGKFRWNYDEPAQQEIVGDGEKIWIYDIDLEQVSVRDQRTTLGATPAILLAGKHLDSLKKSYDVIDIGTQGRFDWVNLVPKSDDSGFTEVRIGFEKNRLRLMELVDTLGQRTRISFVDLKENLTIPLDIFSFTPPAGVDVMDESDF